ncbi:MAG: GntR family transcriptional regulator [Desulfitobacterium sp.]|nr:GntR family transcriptional regulator [Desulfitobacterium sp.]
MKNTFDNSRPIYVQIREIIEDQIVNNQLKEGEQAPSTNQLVNFYKVNHITVSKGVNQLIDEGILFKKRGVGTFVAEGARERLLEKRKKAFLHEHLTALLTEAEKLGITTEELIYLIKTMKGRDQ